MIYFFKSSNIRVNVEKNYNNVTVKEKYGTQLFFFSYFVLLCYFVLLHYFVCLEDFFVYLFGFVWFWGLWGCGGEGGVCW